MDEFSRINSGIATTPLMEQARTNSLSGPLTMTDRLKNRRDMLKRELTAVEEAIEAMEANEDVARAVDAITRLGHF